MYPEAFIMAIETPEMEAEAEQTAITVLLAATTSGVTVKRVYGIGANWINYLGLVVNVFPPAEWAKRAMRDVVDFMMLDDMRERLAERGVDLPIPELDSATGGHPDAGVQRRRRLTPDHLQEVADVYEKAQKAGEPPTRAVQYHFDVSHSTAAKWVGKARTAGLLAQLG